MKKILIASTVLLALCAASCKKNNCQTCTKTIGGVAGNIIDEERVVCNDKEAKKLENSSSGTTIWKCE